MRQFDADGDGVLNEEEQAAAERLMDLMNDVTATSKLDLIEDEVEILEEVRKDLRKEYPYR